MYSKNKKKKKKDIKKIMYWFERNASTSVNLMTLHAKILRQKGNANTRLESSEKY